MARTPNEQLAEYYSSISVGAIVWCDWVEQEAAMCLLTFFPEGKTVEEFCEYCGKTNHKPIPERRRPE